MHSKLTKLRDALSIAINGMTVDELTRRREGKWCSGEILEHLNLTYIGTIKNLERRLAEGRPCSRDDRGKKRWQRIAVTRLGYIPTGRKSPERVMPRGAPTHQVIADLMENIDCMDRVISECESQFPRGVPIAEHPILGPLTAQEWRAFHFAHGRHHIKQLRGIRKLATR